MANLQELQIKAPNHPLSQDLAPTDYHFFRNLDNYVQGKQCSFRRAVENDFQEFMDYHSSLFYFNEMAMECVTTLKYRMKNKKSFSGKKLFTINISFLTYILHISNCRFLFTLA